GSRRLRRWREKANFKDDRFFFDRLEAEGLEEELLRRMLGEDGAAVKSRTAEIPAWLANWTSAFSDADLIESSSARMTRDQWRDHPSLAFLTAIAPLVRHGRERLRAGVEALIAANADSPSELPFDPVTIENLLFGGLPVELAGMMSRTMALELNVARVSEELTGETPDERFESFISRLADPVVAQRIFTEYPVLARSLTETIDRRIDAGLELLERLSRDWPEIRSRLCGSADPGKMTELSFGMGDTHCGGRTVAVMSFRSPNSCDSANSGNSVFKLVYKPRSLAVEVHFQELLAWLNERGEHPPFRLTHVIDRGEYGWVEFIAAAACEAPDEVKRFYRRQGAYLALLYGLEATDFHAENLIAAGEHPVLIDLESLFHAREKIKPRSESKAVVAARNAIADSVMRIGLLPVRIWGDDENEGIDVSGLGKDEGQISPNPAPYWENGGTDEMRLERKRVPIHGSLNRPVYEGRPLSALDYAEDILDGFTGMYRLLLRHCDELISGPLAAFGEDETRCILRPTMIYGWMLSESFHPDLQRDALDRDRYFDRMWLAVEHCPELRRAVPFELRDLREGDVPMFTSRPASRDLFASRRQRIEGFFDRSGLELVESKLRSLSVDDSERQCWFIRASLCSLADDLKPAGELPPLSLTARRTISKARLIEAARDIGDRLETMAYRGDDDALWLGLTFNVKKHSERHWTLTPIGIDLYDGLPGIALFLSHLGRMTGERRYTDLARAAVVSIRRQIEDGKQSLPSLGGFSGLGGVIYAFTHLADLLDQPELLDEAESLIEQVPQLLKQDKMFDILGGAAGCLTALLGLHRLRQSERALNAAGECGEHLLANVKQMDRGAAWHVDEFAKAPLAGFSHGATGVAYALLELFAETGDERFRRTALEALEYERGLFSAELANWPDLRDVKNSDGSRKESGESGEEPRFIWAWCHGAAGAALGRIKILSICNDEALLAEAEAATRSTLRYGMVSNHSLCHGSLGNLETLLLAGEAFADRRLAASVNQLASAIVESFEVHGWVCGNPMNVESPGLMTGLAGIGYQLLRLAEPRAVPSVLALEAPIETAVSVNASFAVAD
ncbi:MAG TPA: type 2 lanthipeptide synthetase LanM family protein, partial [Blastocatellia bacterium]|nr:type 2 lanthipeptide synthetase LanM family protein [Blastocatellia bacterium]